MAISDKSSSTTQQEYTKLQEQLKNGATEASSYLDSLTSKFTDYDNSHKSLKDTATSYFQGAMDRARASVEQLKKSGEDIRTSGNNASDSAVDAAKNSVAQVSSAFDDLGTSAQAYDKQLKDSINSKMDDAKKSSSQSANSWSDSITSLVTSTRDATFHGFEALQNQFTATQKSMSDQASSAKSTTKSAASDAADGISKMASEASEAVNPNEPTLMERATGAVSSSLGYVTSAFQTDELATDKAKAPTKSS